MAAAEAPKTATGPKKKSLLEVLFWGTVLVYGAKEVTKRSK